VSAPHGVLYLPRYLTCLRPKLLLGPTAAIRAPFLNPNKHAKDTPLLFIMASATVIGSTGLVGGEILTALLASEAFTTVHTISRRAPKTGEHAKLRAAVEPDSSAWAARLKGTTPVPDVVLSALGTTRAAAGSVEAQWKIDHDLNVELAEAAKEVGVRTFVFVSSGGTRGVGSVAPYSKMKIGVEDKVKALGFDNAIILRPRAILGKRENESKSTSSSSACPFCSAAQLTCGLVASGNSLINTLLNGLGKVSPGLKDALGQEHVVIARAALAAARLAVAGEAPSKIWVLETTDILRLGRDEWKA